MPDYDQAAARILLSNSTAAAKGRALARLSRTATREIGAPTSEPCDRCGCVEYQVDDGDILCSHCGLPHGMSDPT